MALFEFEDGHLVPAQFGYPVSYDLGPELVDAICQQVLQIVSRPLFPVTWRDMTGQDDEETPRLTALDVTGQIVSVEILKLLDSETLITSLSRLAIVASLSWSDLAGEYPTGSEGFRAGWAQFRDSMPPAVGPGPRLIMVAGEIDPSVRPALSILATSGVEVHLMNLRQMSNGRLFLDVNAVGPRLYGHAPQLLGSMAAASAIAAGPASTVPEAPVDSEKLEAAAEENLDDAAQEIPEPPVSPVTDADAKADGDGDAEDATESETPTTRPTPNIAPHLRDAFHYSVDEEPPAPWKSKDSPEEQSDEAGAGSDELVEEFVEEETEIDDRVDEAADAVEADDTDGQVGEDYDAADAHATEAFDDAEERIESEGEIDGGDERERVETLDAESDDEEARHDDAEPHDEERDRGESAAGDADHDDSAAGDAADEAAADAMSTPNTVTRRSTRCTWVTSWMATSRARPANNDGSARHTSVVAPRDAPTSSPPRTSTTAEQPTRPWPRPSTTRKNPPRSSRPAKGAFPSSDATRLVCARSRRSSARILPS